MLLGKLGGRVRLTDAERRRFGRLGHELGRKVLREVASIAIPRRDQAAGLGGRDPCGTLNRARDLRLTWPLSTPSASS